MRGKYLTGPGIFNTFICTTRDLALATDCMCVCVLCAVNVNTILNRFDACLVLLFCFCNSEHACVSVLCRVGCKTVIHSILAEGDDVTAVCLVFTCKVSK